MALAQGTILGQYEIRSPLGAGGMGEVYRARDTRLEREVAIKVLPESFTSDPERLRRFELEARAAAALNHPNILAVYQMATHEGVSYLVSELLEGETLRERIKRGPVPLSKAIDYGVQIADGLAAAHERGIVHRDLKPENLFLNKDGRVKILDFGLAKLVPAPAASPDGRTVTLQEETEPGAVVGTVGYMSPEQVRGGTADHRSDIFAFGTILYEMVTGKRAFRKPTSPETMVAILNEDPPPISQLAADTPAGMQRVVQRCLEKNPEQRFYSAHDLAFALESISDWAISPVPSGPAQESTRPNRMRFATAGVSLLLVLGAAVLGYLWMRPEPVPKVSNYLQLTHDGKHKWLAGTDGSRLYLSYGAYASRSIAEISIAGGELTRIPTPSPNLEAADISPDGAELLVVDSQGKPDTGPLWGLPVLGGSPRRLGDTVGIDGTWSPDGKMLAYCNGNELFLAKADGTESRKLVTMKDSDLIYHASWSPDGGHLRFDVQNPADGSRFLWEITLDGADLHRLLPGWNKPPDSECCGRWTADGKYFVFVSRGQIWALPQKGGLLHSGPQPVPLTSSPLWLTSPLPSKDGKKLFVVGRTFWGELTRFDVKSGQFVPFLGGISAEYVAFSRDGQWVAYVSYPEGTLWRSKADGSERMQLTYPPNYAMLPRWSPDGKKIVFFENIADKPSRIYEVSPEGGIPRQLMPDDPQPQWDPNWSPDGSKIVFGGAPYNAASAVRILDLASRQVSTLPGSTGLFQPSWSPDGRYISAVSSDSKTLGLFDFQTQKWTEVAKGTLGWPNWSKDGQHLQILDSSGTGAILRIRLSDRNVERVVDLKNFSHTGHLWTGLAIAPDDSPLLLRDVGDQGVYALDWEAP
jgi:serine/threonine protein kinase/Tol biopolymer transport system component